MSSIIIVSLFWWCRGVIRVDVNIQGFNVDQCASGDFWFANTHQCNRTSMEVSVYTEHKLNNFINDLLQASWSSRVIKFNQHFTIRFNFLTLFKGNSSTKNENSVIIYFLRVVPNF